MNSELILRPILTFTILFILTRIMGKKQIAQLTFFDYVVGITIGSITGNLTVNRNIPIVSGITALLIWGVLPIIISYLTIKSMKARRILDGMPTILIQNGKILDENLKRERFNINEFLAELRRKDTFNVADVEFAILETDGQISVQKKSQHQPITPSDLNIPTKYSGLCSNLIIDGNIMHEHLSVINLSENWLREQLNNLNIDNVEQILLASLDTEGNLYINLKDKSIKEMKVLE